jgi:hypothetical protein
LLPLLLPLQLQIKMLQQVLQVFQMLLLVVLVMTRPVNTAVLLLQLFLAQVSLAIVSF